MILPDSGPELFHDGKALRIDAGGWLCVILGYLGYLHHGQAGLCARALTAIKAAHICMIILHLII